MRDRLIEILNKADKRCDECKQCEQCVAFSKGEDCINYLIADTLLANGVIVPPCKVGDTLWIINSYANSRLEIINRIVEPIEVESVAISKDGIEIETAEAIYFSEHFGKTIFLTKELAEKALAERSGE